MDRFVDFRVTFEGTCHQGGSDAHWEQESGGDTAGSDQFFHMEFGLLIFKHRDLKKFPG